MNCCSEHRRSGNKQGSIGGSRHSVGPFCDYEICTAGEQWAEARHINNSGRVTLLIDGDDGTSLTKREIAAALHHPDRPHHAA
jgi:hypothetical protein